MQLLLSLSLLSQTASSLSHSLLSSFAIFLPHHHQTADRVKLVLEVVQVEKLDVLQWFLDVEKRFWGCLRYGDFRGEGSGGGRTQK